jgi:hypothetical protein
LGGKLIIFAMLGETLKKILVYLVGWPLNPVRYSSRTDFKKFIVSENFKLCSLRAEDREMSR